jgi:hypothetical protein
MPHWSATKARLQIFNSLWIGTQRSYIVSWVCNVNGAASGDGVLHTNRKPLSFMKKLRPKNPLFLAVIEKAQVPSMAIIAGFCHDCLPTTDSAFESLSNSKSHRPSSYRSRANQLTTTQLYQVYRG